MLGVDVGASPEEVRRAYRHLIRVHHPDVSRADPDAHLTAARLTHAYALIRTEPAPDVSSSAGAPERRSGESSTVTAPNAVPLRGPTRAVFDELREAADLIGDVSYVDRELGILETVVRREGWPVCSLLVTLQQRGEDTLAQCTLESLEGPPGPPIELVVRDLQRALRLLTE